MLEYLENYKGSLTVNNILYTNVSEAKKAIGNSVCNIHVVLGSSAASKVENRTPSAVKKQTEVETAQPVYFIKVRQYMTKPATPAFDFHDKYNNGKPMPMRQMAGTIIQETKGMFKMSLFGAMPAKKISHCMRCGRELTNPVSQYFGLGPECGGHNYVNPFESEQALKEAVEVYKENVLKKITWEGWVIKSSIESKELFIEEEK